MADQLIAPAQPRTEHLLMSDQAAPENSDQPNEAEVTEAPDTSRISEGEDRYTQYDLSEVPEDYRAHVEEYNKRLQGDYTRKMQELSQQRKTYEESQDTLQWIEELNNDPQTRYALLQHIAEMDGYSLDGLEAYYGGEPVEDLEDEEVSEEFRDPRLDPLLEEIDQAKQQQEYETWLDTTSQQMAADLEGAAKELGRDLSNEEIDFVTNYALLNQSEEGQPDIRGAVQRLRAVEAGFQTRWIESKKAPQIHSGQPGSEGLNLNDQDVRRRYMEDLVNAQNTQDNT